MKKDCFKFQEFMQLDVYEELDPESQRVWGNHLVICKDCRGERKKLTDTLNMCRSAESSPELTAHQADELTWAVLARLKKEKEKATWQQWLPAKPAKLIPLAAAASILIMAIGWMNLSEPGLFNPLKTASHISAEERQMIKDMAVIQDMELLEEMESLQKLIQVVDQPESEAPGNSHIFHSFTVAEQGTTSYAGHRA
jgi:hypothetical protein